MLAFSIGFLVGEAIRDDLYGAPDSTQDDVGTPQSARETAHSPARCKWERYSGLFILLKRKITLSAQRLRRLQSQVVAAFAVLVQPLPVRT